MKLVFLKYNLIILLLPIIFCVALTACNSNNLEFINRNITNCLSPKLVDPTIAYQPYFYYLHGRMSHDYKYFAIKKERFFHLYDLINNKNNPYISFNVAQDSYFTPTSDLFFLQDNLEELVAFGSFESASEPTLTYRIYKANFIQKICTDITPELYKDKGMDINTRISLLNFSKNSIFVNSEGSKFIYNFASKEITKTGLKDFYQESYDGRFIIELDSSDKNKLYINNREIIFRDSFFKESWVSGLSVSYDSKLLAISLHRRKFLFSDWENERFDEIWIIDLEKTNSGNIQFIKLNLKDLYCMYAYYGTFASFTSNGTLILSMYRDGSQVSNYYEINRNGDLLKQLTE